MHDAQKDLPRAQAAARAIIDGRDPAEDFSTILITLDHTIATVLLVTMGMDATKAVLMLNEGVVPQVEERIALFASRHSQSIPGQS